MALLTLINGITHWHEYDGQTFASVTAAFADGLRENGNTVLIVGAVADGQYLKRQGSNIVGTSTIIAEVDYTPAVLADWTGSVDPGGMDEALDQLASRLTIDVAGLASHIADTVDPHGSIMTVSTKLIVPTIEYTSPFLQIDVIDASTSTLSVGNSGAGVCDLSVSGSIAVGGLVDGVDIAARDGVLTTHMANTVDPHGSTTSITVQLNVPKIVPSGSLTIDLASSGSPAVYILNTNGFGGGNLNVSDTVTVGSTLNLVSSATTIQKDVNGNLEFKDANAGVLTLSELSKPKLIQLVDDNSTAGFNELTDYHILDATNWNTSKAVIKEIIFVTTSTQWDFYLLQNAAGFGADSAVVKKRKIVSGAKSNLHLILDLSYEDEDATNKLHFYFEDRGGTAKLDKITVLAVEAR